MLCGVCIGVLCWIGPLNRMTIAQDKTVKQRLTALPQIKSCVEHIKVTNAKLVDVGDSQVADLELENKAYVGVISIALEIWGHDAKNSVVWSAFSPDKEPQIVLAPGERGTMRIGNLSADLPIRVGSVMFSDGTEEGCETSKKTMRMLKDKDTKKGGPNL
jgi:hypothetical protein